MFKSIIGAGMRVAGRAIRRAFERFNTRGRNEPLEQTLLDRLPEAYRLPMWLHFGEGLSFSDIAEILSVGERSVPAQLREGMELYRRHLERAGATTPAATAVRRLSAARASHAPKRLQRKIRRLVELS